MSRKEEIEEIINPLLNELREIRNEELRTQNEWMVGKYFKYQNSYGGSPEDEKWWLYSHVYGLYDSGELKIKDFELTCDGCIRINEGLTCSVSVIDGQEITKTEYDEAWQDLIAVVQGINVPHET